MSIWTNIAMANDDGWNLLRKKILGEDEGE